MLALVLLAACGTPDPVDSGDPIVVVEARAPSAPGAVWIEPAEPSTLHDLVLVIGEPATDPDGDLTGHHVRWAVDGTAVPDLDDLRVVPAEVTARDQEWAVAVSGFDAGGRESPAATASVVVVNLPPRDPVVTIAPQHPFPGEDDLHCSAEATDPDGDEVDITTWWERNGEPWPDVEVLASDIGFDEQWRCSAQASDGTATGGVATTSVTTAVAPRVPDLALVDVNPSSSSFEQPVSPRDYLERVSGWYFGHAT